MNECILKLPTTVVAAPAIPPAIIHLVYFAPGLLSEIYPPLTSQAYIFMIFSGMIAIILGGRPISCIG